MSSASFAISGSSPRMRGTRQPFDRRCADQRFIPAYAGNAKSDKRRITEFTVHPRVCGERTAHQKFTMRSFGSSPRMRGTQKGGFIKSTLFRFIPAYAGNADRISPARRTSAVHPRVCGERLRTNAVQNHRAGSSPRMRGTQDNWTDEGELPRFIPAYAGNASTLSVRLSTEAVHPRVCGERHVQRKKLPQAIGSSPRMRGTQLRDRVGAGPLRFIPAYAGNART